MPGKKIARMGQAPYMRPLEGRSPAAKGYALAYLRQLAGEREMLPTWNGFPEKEAIKLRRRVDALVAAAAEREAAA